MKKLFTAILFSILISCGRPTNLQFDILSPPTDSRTLYFKTKEENDTTNNTLNSFVNSWYSRMLFAMKEPVLSNYKGDKEIFRFTWLRTFHHPIVIRLERQDQMIKIFSKVWNGAGGYEVTTPLVDTTFDLTANELNIVSHLTEKAGFWTLPTEKKNERGFDGSEWIIECVKNNEYHIVARWTPDKLYYKDFRSIAMYLFSLSKIKGETVIY